MDAVQQKWLLRVILKDVRLRLDETTILTKMQPDAKDYFEVNANLLEICKRKRRGSYLGEIYRQPEPEDIDNVISDSLKGKVVVVEPGHLEKKQRIEKLVMRHGGKVEQNVKEGKTDLYVELGMTVKGKNVVASKNVDVVTSSWALDQDDLDTRSMMMPLPHQYIWWTEKTARDWTDRSDRFLDPLTVPATRDSLKFSTDKVEEMGRADQLSQSAKASFESELDITYNVFREMTFYFDAKLSVISETECKLAKGEVKFCGGLVNDDLDLMVSHVVVQDTRNPGEHIRSARKRRLEEDRKLFHVVTMSWIHECVHGGKITSESDQD